MIFHDSIIHDLTYLAIGLIIGIGIWVAFDAKKREMENPLRWGLIVAIFNIIGLLIYLFQRPRIFEDKTEVE